MTVASTSSIDRFKGNAHGTKDFDIHFMFIKEEDLTVVLLGEEGNERKLELGTDYTLTGAGTPSGGILSLKMPPLEGETVTIKRDPEITQEVEYLENAAFPAESHERALDKLTMICQSLSEKMGRTITFRVSSAVGGIELPMPEPGKSLAWNADGNNLMNGPDVADISAVQENAIAVKVARDEATVARDTTLGYRDQTVAAATSLGDLPAHAVRDDKPATLGSTISVAAQHHIGADLSDLDLTKGNEIVWTQSGDMTISEINPAADMTLELTIIPDGGAINVASAYDTNGIEPDPTADLIEAIIKARGSRKRVAFINYKGAI